MEECSSDPIHILNLVPISSFLDRPTEPNNGSLHFGYSHTPIVAMGSKKLPFSWVSKEPSPVLLKKELTPKPN